jgi:N-acetylmuramoyl-L-alanine amidase
MGIGIAASLGVISMAIPEVARAEQPLTVVYPTDGHETTATKIFLIGTAPAQGEVTVNGQPIQRSSAGHFAPSFPLQVGDNQFVVRYQQQEVTLHVKRTDSATAPTGTAFAAGSLSPAIDVAYLPSQPICFNAIAPAGASVAVTLKNQTVSLLPQPSPVDLPPNSAVLTLSNQPVANANPITYQGCIAGEAFSSLIYGNSASNPVSAGAAPPNQSLDLGYPQFRLSLRGQTVTQAGPGKVELLSSASLPVVEVTADAGTARTGPSTDYSRLTPLPKGTRASVTGREGEWLKLDYGGWIKAAETQVIPNASSPQTLIRSIRARQVSDWTEIAFPLQVPVPVSVDQGDRSFTLTLYNTTAQTDTILLNDDPVIQRLDWQQVNPTQVQYRFNLKSQQQWGYKLRYDGTTLILSLKHPPQIQQRGELKGIKILLDPGHGGPEDLGSVGPTGYPEKAVALTVTQLLRQRLEAKGATVIMTRTADIDLLPQDRATQINQLEPTISISLHYNALPDDGDAMHTAGVGAFWYNAQAHSLAMSLHHYLVDKLNRPSYGVFWNNLALTRPTVAPAVLLELGFMINPEEFQWISDPQSQAHLADTLAAGIAEWLYTATHS